MKRIVTILTIGVISLGLTASSHASDWETFGKVMAGVEGLRVITGGEVDIVGSLTGIKRDGPYVNYYSYPRRYRYYRPYRYYRYPYRRRYFYPRRPYFYPRRRGIHYYYYTPWRGYGVIIRDRDRPGHHRHHHKRKHKGKDKGKRKH